MNECIFCKVIKGEIPAKKVYEDKEIIVIDDVNPQAPIHLLIIPKRHIPTSMELENGDKDMIGSVFLIANRVAEERGIADPGFRVVMNCNEGAGQSVFHIHFHLLGGRNMKWPPG